MMISAMNMVNSAAEVAYMAGKLANPFTPEFLKWTLPSLNLNMSTDANRGFSLK